ncbi:FkbM family methyltransferase [Aestuariivita boseongensis]|uniref:FkbM family methyltransferase n=1 Tax=Aestuariivita boseongensis TaxID=1470562 RepID=UPI00068252D7|nr:FkbM family methyltransferase [Aestuariivita boseongensis]
MDTAFIKFKRSLRCLRHVGLRQYLRYLCTRRGKTLPLWIGETEVCVRRGTPDLTVAITSLNGEFDLLKTALPSDFDGVIVDAGGYIGTAAIALSRMFPKAQVITIEPARQNLLVLRQNVARFPMIRHVHGALVGQPGPDVKITDRGTGAWGFTAVAQEDEGVLVNTAPALQLSELGVDLSEIGLLKLDIEGSEYDLLTHAAPSLQQIHAIFIELHDRIVSGCSEAFYAFSADRQVIRDRGEKFLSLRV